ncbi:MAG: TetR family transcriptional regulator [Saprospiraceae bacterium]|nr:TetR family transcriptional regulator [Saprospiraceae bacterium]
MDKPEIQDDSSEQRIFDAAHEVFVQKGLHGAKMQEIADRAGINKALLHYYYRSKEKLYETVVRAVINRVLPVLRDLLESDKPLLEKIDYFIHFYLQTVSKNPFVPLFLINEMNKNPDHFFETIFPKELPKPDRFFQQVQSAVEAGEIKPITPQHLIVNVISMCIFPILARPMLGVILGMQAHDMRAFLNQREVEIRSFVHAALRPAP